MLPERVRVCIHWQIFASGLNALCFGAEWEPCLRGIVCPCVCVVMAAQTVDRGTVVCCFAEMMMPPSIQ